MSYSTSPDQDDYYGDTPKRKSAAGRKLVRWNPDLDQLVLLCVDHVCTKNGIAIPWDDVAKLVEPHLTGEAIKQHLVKIYKFREEDGHAVPPKLDRHQRRKAFDANSGGGAPTPARGRGKRAATNDDDDDEIIEEPQRPAESVKPGRSLLFKKPQSKSKRAPKKETAAPKTPAIGRGRKKGQPLATPVSLKLEDDDDSEVEVAAPKAKSVGRGAKRDRKPKKIDEDDEEELGYDTPSKKPKTESYLRSQPAVDYAAQMAQEADDEEGTYEEEIALKSAQPKNEQHSSQGSSDDYGAPPPHFGLPTPAHVGQYHDYLSVATPAREYGNDVAPFNSSPVGCDYGLGGFRTYENYGAPPIMQIPSMNNLNQDFNPVPTYHGNNAFNFNSNVGYGSDIFGPGTQAEGVNALNQLHNSSSTFNPFRNMSTIGRSGFEHTNGIMPENEKESKGIKNTSSGTGAFDGTDSGGRVDVFAANAIGHGMGNLNHGLGLHLNTSIHDNHDSLGNTTFQNAFSTDGETGITPDMHQTGFGAFEPHPLPHNASFDSGLGSDLIDDKAFEAMNHEPKFHADDFFGAGGEDDEEFAMLAERGY